MFDPKRTLALISGALFNRDATWREFLPGVGNWQKTALQLTVPLIVITALGSYLLSSITMDTSLLGQFKPTLTSTLFSIVFGLLGACIIAGIFGGLSGVFGGKSSFALGFAAISLAFVPGYLGQFLAWVPWIGGLLGFGLFIYSLVLLWKIIPLYLEVPDGKRAVHYVVSLIATILVMVIISRTLMPLMPGMPDGFGQSYSTSTDDDSGLTGGIVSSAMRAAELMEQAERDEYTPPSDGKLTETQVQNYIAALSDANQQRMEALKRIEAAKADASSGGQVSMTDLAEIMSGVQAVSGIGTVEIEAVKSAGGNWAEHQWVQQKLLTASRMQNATEATAHNFALYEKYADDLERATSQQD